MLKSLQFTFFCINYLLFSASTNIYVNADSYDVGGTDPICWKTDLVNGGTTKLDSCPDDFKLEFILEPPKVMYGREYYPVQYRFSLDIDAIDHYQVNDVDIPHANIHSCVSTVGFCTPFVSNTPGLSTHTPALSGDVEYTSDGIYTVDFIDDMKLEDEQYTIIAHVRVFGEEGGITYKYDMAAAIFRTVLPPQDILTVGKSVNIGMIVWMILVLFILSCIFVMTVYHRTHKILKFSQVNFLIIMNMLAIVGTAGLFTYRETNNTTCALRPWLVIIPLNLIFGLLFGKTWRIWKLMNQKSLKAVKIKESKVLLISLLVTLPEIILHGTVSIIDKPKAELVNVINEYTFEYQCTSSLSSITKILHLFIGACILILGCYVANQSNKLTTLFNEGKHITFSIYTCALLSVLILPTSFAVDGNPDVSYILVVMGVAIATSITVCSINLPKLYMIVKDVKVSLNESNANQTIKNATRDSTPTSGRQSTIVRNGITTLSSSIPFVMVEHLSKSKETIEKVLNRHQQGLALEAKDVAASRDAVIAMNEYFQNIVIPGYPSNLSTTTGIETTTPIHPQESSNMLKTKVPDGNRVHAEA